MRRALKWSAAILAVLALSGGGLWLLVISIPLSMLYCVEGEFTALPGDDKPLVQSLEAIRGVISGSVYVDRDEEGRRIRVSIGISQNYWGPPRPDFEGIARRLGYEGQIGRFEIVGSDEQCFFE